MSSNFRARFVAELDTAKIKQDIDNLKNKYGNIKVQIDFGKTLRENQAATYGTKAGKAYSAAFQTQMRDKIKLKLESGDFQTKIESIANKMQSLNRVSDITKTNFDNLKSAFSVIGADNTSIQEKIKAYNTFNSLLPTIRAQLNLAATEEKQYAQSVRDAMQEQLTLNRSATLSNDIQTWMNNNTRAAKQYGEELRGLQSKLKNNTDASALNEVSTKFREIKSEARASGVAVSHFGLNFKQAVLYALGIGSLTQVISKCVRVTKEMVETTIELDDAMAQLKIVTRATESEYNKFKDSIFNIAKDISANATDLIDSSTTYARLGYSLDASEILSKYTAMLKNVGDIDISSAQSALTAIFKAFDLNVNDIESIMDKLIEVGNNYPISVKELAEGINNAGSMLASAGNSYDETLAMLAAANTTVQDISKASTGLRTVAARIRNAKTELDELGEVITEAEYDDLVQGLTKYNVTLTDSQGNFRSTYDILKDLSNVWNDLSNLEQASIAKLLAGTRQQNVFYSLIGQFDEAKNAMNSMADSTGALQSAYGDYLDTNTAHIETFKTAFTELADTIVNGELLNFFIDFGTEAVEITTAITEFIDSIGGIRTVLLAIASALLLAKGGLIAYKLELIATAAIEKIITFFSAIKTAILNIVNIIPNAVAAWKAYAVGTATASTAMQASIPIIGLVLAGLTALSAGIALASSGAQDAAEKLKDSASEVKDIKDEVDGLNGELNTTKQRIDELLSKPSLTIVEQNELENLQKTNGELERQLELKERALKVSQGKNANNFVDVVNSKKDEYGGNAWRFGYHNYGDSQTNPNKTEEHPERPESNVSDENYKQQYMFVWRLEDYKEAEQKYLEALQDGNDQEAKKWEDRKTQLDTAMSGYVSDMTGYLQDLGDYDYNSLSDSAKAAVDYINDIQNAYLMATGNSGDSVFSNIYNQERFAEGKKAIESLKEEGKLTAQTFAELYQSNDSVKALVDNMQEVGLINDTTAETFDNLTNQINGTNKVAQETGSSINDITKITEEISDLTSELDKLKSAYNSVSDIIDDYNSNGYYTLENLQSLLELEPAYINALIDENGQINLNSQAYKDYVAAKAKTLVVDQIKSLYESILAMSTEEAQAYANAFAYDAETDSLEDLIVATTQYYLILAKAQDAENNTTAYTEGLQKSFGTVANYAAIYDSWLNSLGTSTNEFSTATKESKTALEKQKDALEKQKDALENSKDALEDYKNSLEGAQDNIQSLIDLVVDYIKQTKEDEKSALEEQIDLLDKQKDALDEQKDAYADLIDKKKEEIDLLYEEKKAQDELSDKQKSAAKDALALAVANLDDSSAGKKSQKQAKDNYASSKKDLADYLDDQAHDKRIAALEEQQEKYEETIEKRKALIDKQVKNIQKKIDKIDKYLSNSRKLYIQACKLIDKENKNLYDKLWKYVYKNTTMTKAEFNKLWSDAQESIKKYKNEIYNESSKKLDLISLMEKLQKKIYNTDTKIGNLNTQIGNCEGKISKLDTAISNTSSSIKSTSGAIKSVSTSLNGLGSSVSNYLTKLQKLSDYEKGKKKNNGYYYKFDGRTYISKKTNKEEAISDIIKQIKSKYNGKLPTGASNIRYEIQAYAKGTRNSVGGLSITQEDGFEAIFGKLQSGQYTMMPQGSQVFNSGQTDNLYNFSADPQKFMSDLANKINYSRFFSEKQGDIEKNIRNISNTSNRISGDTNVSVPINIKIAGDATQSTVNAFKKEANNIKEDVLKTVLHYGSFNRKNRW